MLGADGATPAIMKRERGEKERESGACGKRKMVRVKSEWKYGEEGVKKERKKPTQTHTQTE